VAYLDEEEILQAYEDSTSEADQWRIDYPQYERLADNGLLEDLDENLPEVNDGSLAASLFKLAKRVIKKNLGGQAVALDRDDEWITTLANIYWNKKILPNAKSKATPRRKWKDAVRKAAIFGGQPIITLFVQRGNYRGADFIVPYAQDVKLEAGKDSDEDSDIIFWDVYYSDLQIDNMIEEAKEELADAGTPYVANAKTKDSDNDGDSDKQPKKGDRKVNSSQVTNTGAQIEKYDSKTEDDEPDDQVTEPYNRWDIDALIAIRKSDAKQSRSGRETPKGETGKGVRKTGHHFVIAFQRGVDAPFSMMHLSSKKCVREWNNPDPTGDVPVHYLYCYQDFVNPYGIGIVKLAGGTQNVLDYMRQADVLATQLGLRPPKQIIGDEDEVDEDSLVYAQDANWYVGNAKVERMEMANGVYSQLPGRINMYKQSLNNLLPQGDTSIAADNGDPNASKTPAGVKFAAANLSIDDEDFSENVEEAYAAVSKSMINTEFANMQGNDLLQLSTDERDQLMKAGLEFPLDQTGQPTKQLQIIWDNSRATFDFEIDPSTNNLTSDAEQVTVLQDVIKTMTPQTIYYLAQAGWKFDMGETLYAMLSKMNLVNFNAVIQKMTDEDKQKAQQQPFPIIDPPQIRLTGKIPTAAMGAALQSGGVNLPQNANLMEENIDYGDIMKDASTTVQEKAQIKQMAGITPDPNAQEQPPEGAVAVTPDPNAETDRALKTDAQAHQQALEAERLKIDKGKLMLEAHKTFNPPQKDGAPTDPKAAGAPTEPQGAAAPTKPSNAPALDMATAQAHIKQVMELYHVDAHVAAAALEAERQGYPIQEVIAGMKRNSGVPVAAGGAQ
jgi:hypothetical protein